VKGRIDANARKCWVKALRENVQDQVAFARELDDEALGLTTAAAGCMKTNVSNALHKVNKDGMSKGWGGKTTRDKATIINQQEDICAFLEVLEAECRKREAEGIPVRPPAEPETPDYHKQTIQIDMSQNIAPDEMEELVEIMEESGHKVVTDCELYELVKDVPLQEILLFAQKGLNGGDNTKLQEELAAAVADNVRHVEEKQKLEKQLQSKTDELLRLQAKFNTLEKEHGDLKRENKKAKQKLDQFKQLSARL